MIYKISYFSHGIIVTDTEDGSTIYCRYSDIPELVDELKEAYVNSPEHRERNGHLPE